MNNKKAKAIRKHSKTLLVSWMKGLLSEEEGSVINVKNYEQFMAEQTHIYVNKKFILNAYHPKWIAKKIKQLLIIYPNMKITDIGLKHIQWLVQKT